MTKLAVFDLDGTLHHTELALAPAIARAAADITGGDEPPYELINSLYGEPLELFCKTLTGRDDTDTTGAFMTRLRHHQSITIPESGALYPGTVEMLEELAKEGFDLAVLSNAHTDYIEAVTGVLGIRELFTGLCGRGEAPSKAKRLEELARGYDFAVMVGDRYHDIQAAGENRIPAIACAYGYGETGEYEGADAVVHSPGEIAEAIRSILRLHNGKPRPPCPLP